MNCRACRSDRLDEVFAMDPMPLAGAFAPTAEDARAMTRYPLAWYQCHDCGLVNVYPDIPDELIYSTYSYAASTVPALVRHHAAFAKTLTEQYPQPIRLLDIGGNDGVLLDQLPDEWDLWNLDPSDVARDASSRSSWYWTPDSDQLYSSDAQFDVVTSSNAFAHFTDIAGALDGVARILKPGGDFWIEVHDLYATLRTGQWDTVYHEHKVEWSCYSLWVNLQARGFRIVKTVNGPLHGGVVRVLARKEPPGDIQPTVLTDIYPLQQAYAKRKTPPLLAHSAAYGAAARATVYLNQMSGLPIDYVVDSSPLRHGKFVPGLGVPVLEPWVWEQDQPDTTLITAWNHATDIQAKHPRYEGWVTAW